MGTWFFWFVISINASVNGMLLIIKPRQISSLYIRYKNGLYKL